MRFLIEFPDLNTEHPEESELITLAISNQCRDLLLSSGLVLYSAAPPTVVQVFEVEEDPVEVQLLDLIAVSDDLLWDGVPVQTLTYYSDHISVNVAGSQYTLPSQFVTVVDGKARVKVRGLIVQPELTFERARAMSSGDIRELIP